jgi:hypothetical protein
MTMEVSEVIGTAREFVAAERVYGQPYEKNGVTVIPAAKISGGGGGGTGQGPDGQGSGVGGGFGLGARPVGAYVISGDKVRWTPAVDFGQILLAWFLGLLAMRGFMRMTERRRAVRGYVRMREKRMAREGTCASCGGSV